jgi:hypothetical protein
VEVSDIDKSGRLWNFYGRLLEVVMEAEWKGEGRNAGWLVGRWLRFWWGFSLKVETVKQK